MVLEQVSCHSKIWNSLTVITLKLINHNFINYFTIFQYVIKQHHFGLIRLHMSDDYDYVMIITDAGDSNFIVKYVVYIS